MDRQYLEAEIEEYLYNKGGAEMQDPDWQEAMKKAEEYNSLHECKTCGVSEFDGAYPSLWEEDGWVCDYCIAAGSFTED